MSAQVMVGAFLACILSGFVPLVNGELIVVGAALLLAPAELAPLVLACAAGQMIAKGALFWLASSSPERLPERARRSLHRVEKLRKLRGGAGLVVLASSASGLPPFYLVTLAAGVLGVGFALFTASGFTGTVIRYSVLVWGAKSLAGASALPFP